SAAPAGKSDHANCIYYGLSNFGSIRLTCKQIRMELPDSLEDLLYSQNALHFNSLEEANEYLFGLSERRRCIITYLRFSVPDCFGSSIFKDEAVYWHWLGLMNYFSCPWDRETLHMNDDRLPAKGQVYFYYSDCYYEHNNHRMGKRWQVGIGGTSWDVGISDLIYKGMPKMDIGLDSTV
ncbi:hypothetical protein DH86_00000793, partial [Scytalidium sp. 3C]